MVGDIVELNGILYQIVWNGGEGLVGDRITRNAMLASPAKRLYNRKKGTVYGQDKGRDHSREAQ